MEFPENCIRGIPNRDFLTPGRLVATHLFYFSDDARDDGWIEQSINWQDDDQAIEFTLRQRKEDGQLQFRAGVAIVPRVELDRIRERSIHGSALSYERRALPDNPYHGNMLLRYDTDKAVMRQIAATLALYAQHIPAYGAEP